MTKVNNKSIYAKLSEKYNLDEKTIQRVIRLGLASMRRTMAMNKRVQMRFGHFVPFDHPEYREFLNEPTSNVVDDDEK